MVPILLIKAGRLAGNRV